MENQNKKSANFSRKLAKIKEFIFPDNLNKQRLFLLKYKIGDTQGSFINKLSKEEIKEYELAKQK